MKEIFFLEWENKHGQIPLTITPTSLLLKPREVLQAMGLEQAGPPSPQKIKSKALRASFLNSLSLPQQRDQVPLC